MITCTFEKGFTDTLRHAVVHALLVEGNKVLLARRAGDIPETGKWNIPGGFLNRDESVDQGAVRELKEETGWDGKIIDLFRINSDPKRPGEDRQNIVFEYLLSPIAKTGEADWESTDATWFPLDALPPADQMAFDHIESLKLLASHLKKPVRLPILHP